MFSIIKKIVYYFKYFDAQSVRLRKLEFFKDVWLSSPNMYPKKNICKTIISSRYNTS